MSENLDLDIAEKELNPTEREILWRQYNLHVDLYKFYLDTTVKINAFFYLVTGGIVTYVFSNIKEPYVKYSLLLPIVLSFGLGMIFIYGSILLKITRQDVFDIRDKLDLETAPEFRVLSFCLRVFGVVFFIVGIALTVLVFIK